MIAEYERTGGFAGIRQRLEIDGDRKRVKVIDRHTGEAERSLGEDELTRLFSLIAAVNGQKPPVGSGVSGQVSDSFTVQLWLGGAATPVVTLSTLAVPLGKGEETPWGELLSFIDGMLTRELEKTRPKGAPRILSAEDLEK